MSFKGTLASPLCASRTFLDSLMNKFQCLLSLIPMSSANSTVLSSPDLPPQLTAAASKGTLAISRYQFTSVFAFRFQQRFLHSSLFKTAAPCKPFWEGRGPTPRSTTLFVPRCLPWDCRSPCGDHGAWLVSKDSGSCSLFCTAKLFVCLEKEMLGCTACINIWGNSCFCSFFLETSLQLICLSALFYLWGETPSQGGCGKET